MSFPTVPIGELFDVRAGNPAPQESDAFGDMGVPFVRAGSLGPLLQGEAEDNLERLSSESARKHRLTLFPPGTILFAKSGMSALKGYIYQLKGPAYVVSHLATLVPKTEVDARYVRWALEIFSPTRLVKDPAYPSIRLPEIQEMPIPLPSLDEQRRVAEILDQADALRTRSRKALEQLRRLSRSMLIQMFGSPDKNPRSLPLVSFGTLISEGPTNGLYKPSSSYGDGTPILRIGDFSNGRVLDISNLRRLRTTEKETSAYGLSEGDLVINRVNSRDHLGKSALIPRLLEATVFESNMMRIKLNDALIDGSYCISFLQLPFIRKQILRGAKDAINQSSINQSDVKSFTFMLPNIDEQRSYARRVTATEAAFAQAERRSMKLDGLFASLQYRFFRGPL